MILQEFRVAVNPVEAGSLPKALLEFSRLRGGARFQASVESFDAPAPLQGKESHLNMLLPGPNTLLLLSDRVPSRMIV